MYKFKVLKNCEITQLDQDMEEFFAAYLEIPYECNSLDLIKEAKYHGADFIFLKFLQRDANLNIEKNIYDIPVFIIEHFNNNENPFLFSNKIRKRYLSIYFDMTSKAHK